MKLKDIWKKVKNMAKKIGKRAKVDLANARMAEYREHGVPVSQFYEDIDGLVWTKKDSTKLSKKNVNEEAVDALLASMPPYREYEKIQREKTQAAILELELKNLLHTKEEEFFDLYNSLEGAMVIKESPDLYTKDGKGLLNLLGSKIHYGTAAVEEIQNAIDIINKRIEQLDL